MVPQQLMELSQDELEKLVPKQVLTDHRGTVTVEATASLEEKYENRVLVTTDEFMVHGIRYRANLGCYWKDGKWSARYYEAYIRRSGNVFVDPTPAGRDVIYRMGEEAAAKLVEAFPDWRLRCMLVAAELDRRSKLRQAAALRKEAEELATQAVTVVEPEVWRLCNLVFPSTQVGKPKPARWRPKT